MFKRAFVLLSGTITGLVGILSFNPPHLAGAISAPVTPTDQLAPIQGQSAASQKTGSQATSEKARALQSPVNKQKTPSASQKSPSASTAGTTQAPVTDPNGSTGTFQGNTVSTKYGPVQVQITVSNGQITNAEALAVPSRDRRSIQISQAVIPWLSQETVRIQSGSVMAVSGATFTSNAWNNSLASALQKAGK